jgi:hypothetical protein
MAGAQFHGTYTHMISLTPAENPATITAAGRVEVASGDGVFGPLISGVTWTVANFGTIASSTGNGMSTRYEVTGPDSNVGWGAYFFFGGPQGADCADNAASQPRIAAVR